MPNYPKLIEHLDKAQQECRRAMADLTPIAKVKQVDAYVLGLLQSIEMILKAAKKAVEAAVKVQSPK